MVYQDFYLFFIFCPLFTYIFHFFSWQFFLKSEVKSFQKVTKCPSLLHNNLIKYISSGQQMSAEYAAMCNALSQCAKLSRLQDVYLDTECSFLTRWKMLYFNPLERFENEGCPVPVSLLLINVI